MPLEESTSMHGGWGEDADGAQGTIHTKQLEECTSTPGEMDTRRTDWTEEEPSSPIAF